MNRRNFSKSTLAVFAFTSLAQANTAQAIGVAVVNKSARVRALSQRPLQRAVHSVVYAAQ